MFRNKLLVTMWTRAIALDLENKLIRVTSVFFCTRDKCHWDKNDIGISDISTGRKDSQMWRWSGLQLFVLLTQQVNKTLTTHKMGTKDTVLSP